MGWLTFKMDMPVKKWFIDGSNKEHFEVLDVAIVQRNTLYAAMKEKATGDVFCAVYMLRWYPKSYHNFSYKDMTEFCGPMESDCPERILKLLTPLNDENDPNGYARGWRNRVQAKIDKRKGLLGDKIVHIPEGVNLTNGSCIYYFHKYGKQMFAGTMHDGKFDPYYRVRNFSLAQYDYKIIR